MSPGASAVAPLVAAALLVAVHVPLRTVKPSGSMRTPTPPVETVDVALPPVTGRTIPVPAGGSFAAALGEARPGDTIVLAAGATFEGPFTIPNKTGPGWILVRSSSPDGVLPPPGTRVTPADAVAMPKLVASRGAVLDAAPGAHHVRFVGLEIAPAPGTFLYALVQLGSSETDPAAVPHHIVFDRCVLRGDPVRGGRRGIAMNSRHTAVVDSHLSDFKEVGADSQAIAGWGGAGPFRIENNYLEAAGENVMFGGADPAIQGTVPSDIVIRRNHFAKPLRWRIGDPAFEGTAWTVKNLLELKNARRVLVDGNLFENCWAHAQNGFAILFTVRNQDGTAPWSVVENVTFTRNIVRHAGSGLNILGRDDSGGVSQRTRRILVRDNLLLDIDGSRWGGRGTAVQMLQGVSDVVFERNTIDQRGAIALAEGPPNAHFVFRRNVANHNDTGFIGTGTAPGLPTLRTYFPGSLVRGNVIVGGAASSYPSGNDFVDAFPPFGAVLDAGADVASLVEGLGVPALPEDPWIDPLPLPVRARAR